MTGIRPGQDTDAPALIALIARCWSDYGLSLHVDAEDPELRALATHFATAGGALWLAPDDTGIAPDDTGVTPGATGVAPGAIGVAPGAIGMVATRPVAPDTWEICRLYVHPARHGTGLAARLLHLAEAHAAAAAARHLVLWTDTRFARAHRFYEKHGYTRTGPTRALHDRARSHEHRYERPLPRPAPPQHAS